MRNFLIIFSASLLLLSFTTDCRKAKQKDAKQQTAVPSAVQNNPAKADKSDSNKTTVQQEIRHSPITDQNSEPNLKNNPPSEEQRNKVEPNRPSDSNSKTGKPEITPTVKAGEEESVQKSLVKFNNDYANILSAHVNSRGMVDYKALKRRRADLLSLLGELKQFDPNEYKAASKEDQIAFWINVYNIQMLNIITGNYPIESYRILRVLPGWEPDSIRYIDKKVGGIEKQKFIVMSEEFTFEELEQEIFYKQLNEPRAFFALTHASHSSPPLNNEPYSGKKLNEQLNDQIKKYLADSTNFQINKDRQKVYLPAILQGSWYGKYFTERYGTDKKFKDQPAEIAAVLNCIIKLLPSDDASFLELKNYSVDFLRYNWLINEQ
jgi:hypothetical protein